MMTSKLITKKNFLKISGSYVLFFIALFSISSFCDSSWCRVHDDDLLGQLIYLFLPLLPVFFLTLAMWKMQDSVFQEWSKFAVWATPLLMGLTILVVSASNNGFGVEGVIGGAFDLLVIGIFYAAFIGVSIWKITAVYDKLKGK